jgi:exonuclease SbcD
MKILLSGDLHIGRSSSWIDPALEAAQFRAVGAWERVVDLAIEHRVSAVVLSGDVVDQSNRFFEAAGPLLRGLRSLRSQGIRTVATTGNHDHRALLALASQFETEGLLFTLLGANGTWQKTVIEGKEGERLQVVGWSFPSDSHMSDPLDTFHLEIEAGAPALGVVHGDLDVADSRYAPLSSARLTGMPVGGWLLGHIHAPVLRPSANGVWMLYPGSPQALDPGERGRHGVWMIDVSDSRMEAPTFLPLSTVRYDEVIIDVSAAENEDHLRDKLFHALKDVAETAAETGGEYLKLVVADLVVVGATPVADRVKSCVAEVVGDVGAGTNVRVRKSTVHATPPLDLAELAQGTTLAAMLARLVLDLESGTASPAAIEMLRNGHESVRRTMPTSFVADGDREHPFHLDQAAVTKSIVAAARSLLGLMVSRGDAAADGGAH